MGIFFETGAGQRSSLNVLRLGKCKRESIGVDAEKFHKLVQSSAGLTTTYRLEVDSV